MGAWILPGWLLSTTLALFVSFCGTRVENICSNLPGNSLKNTRLFTYRLPVGTQLSETTTMVDLKQWFEQVASLHELSPK